MTDASVEKLLTAGDVADVLGIHKMTVYELARAGRIKRVEIGHTVRFRPRDVQAFIDAATTSIPTSPLRSHRRRRPRTSGNVA